MHYPKFENCSSIVIQRASFAAIKKLHKIENRQIVKYGYGVTIKAICPTNLKRQNVKLALQVFNARVAEGLMKATISHILD